MQRSCKATMAWYPAEQNLCASITHQTDEALDMQMNGSIKWTMVWYNIISVSCPGPTSNEPQFARAYLGCLFSTLMWRRGTNPTKFKGNLLILELAGVCQLSWTWVFLELCITVQWQTCNSVEHSYCWSKHCTRFWQYEKSSEQNRSPLRPKWYRCRYKWIS